MRGGRGSEGRRARRRRRGRTGLVSRRRRCRILAGRGSLDGSCRTASVLRGSACWAGTQKVSENAPSRCRSPSREQPCRHRSSKQGGVRSLSTKVSSPSASTEELARTLSALDKLGDVPQALDVRLLALVKLLEDGVREFFDVLVELGKRLLDLVPHPDARDLDFAPAVPVGVVSVSEKRNGARRSETHISQREICLTSFERSIPSASAVPTTSIVCQILFCFQCLCNATASGERSFKTFGKAEGLFSRGLIV